MVHVYTLLSSQSRVASPSLMGLFSLNLVPKYAVWKNVNVTEVIENNGSLKKSTLVRTRES